MSFTVTARVDESGQMLHGHKVELVAWLKKHSGEIVTLTVEKKRKPRSHDQLEWLFGVAYPEIAKAAGYDAHEWKDKATLENIHEGLLQRRYGVVVDKVTGTAHAKERTTGKSALFVSEFMEWLCRWTAQEYRMDPPLTLPDEYREQSAAPAAAGGR